MLPSSRYTKSNNHWTFFTRIAFVIVSFEVAVSRREIGDLQHISSLESFSQLLPSPSHHKLPELEEISGAAVGGDSLQDADSSELSLLGHPNGADLQELHHLFFHVRVLYYRPSSHTSKNENETNHIYI